VELPRDAGLGLADRHPRVELARAGAVAGARLAAGRSCARRALVIGVGARDGGAARAVDTLVLLRDGAGVAEALVALSPADARRIADAARRRILSHHTYANRATQVDHFLNGIALKGEAAE